MESLSILKKTMNKTKLSKNLGRFLATELDCNSNLVFCKGFTEILINLHTVFRKYLNNL